MPKTLLLADDSVVIQKLVGLSFANEDVELVTTDNGDDALERVRELRPDLVLADVVMPGRNGYEVCEAIKTDASLRHIPVLLLTGTFEAFDEERARRVSSDGHITKPFEAQGLVDRVTDLLAKAPAAPPPTPAAAEPPAVAPQAAETSSIADGDDAYDFFDDGPGQDLTHPGRIPDGDDEPSGDDGFAFASDLDSLSDEGPDTLDTNFELDDQPGDLTVAVMEDAAARPTGAPAIPADDRAAPDATQIDLGETMIQDDFAAPPRAAVASLDEKLAAAPKPPSAPAPAQDPAETMLADDLFADPIPQAPRPPDISETTDPVVPPPLDSGFEFGADDAQPVREAPPAPAARATPTPPPAPAAPTATAPPRVAVADPALERAFEAADPLAGMGPDGADAIATVEMEAPSLHDAADSTHSGFDVSSSDLGDPLAGAPLPVSAPVPASGVSSPQPLGTRAPDLSPMMRDQIHETLEKIAWEAFADVSDSIVRQVLERVESIVWDVVPQMAEALIQEEIRRLKGEDS